MRAFTERGRKVHLGIDADTLEIRAIEVTGSRIGDAPMLFELLGQISPDQPIDKVSAPFHGLHTNLCRATDGAYDTRACHIAIAARDACAVIPARKNARLWLENTPGAKARNETVHSTRRLGRAIWRPLSAASFGCAAGQWLERISSTKSGRNKPSRGLKANHCRATNALLQVAR
jgi:hypothetical protein